jgi:GT2 family glycosyltransferase
MDKVDQVQLWGGGKVQFWSGRSRHQLQPAQLDFVSGASLLLRREALEMVGLFDDQSFFMYWEDTDLGLRLRRAGWQLAVAGKSRVWHKQSASLGKGSKLLDEYFTCSGVRFLRRHAPAPWLSVTFMVGRLLLKRLLMGKLDRVRAVFKGYAKA